MTQLIIVGDPVSLITANVIFNKYGNKFVYWNLELYVKSELISWYKIWLKNKEIDANKNAVFLLNLAPIERKYLPKKMCLIKVIFYLSLILLLEMLK